jgi:DNA-binding transcriptional MerR regulator
MPILHDGTSQPLKLYYRIGEVADIVGVEPHVLRYWETEFRSIRPQKSRSGQRVYSRKDVDKLIRVRDLLYTQGFTIAGAKKKLQQLGHEPSTEGDGALAAVRDIRESLLQLREDVLSSMQRLSRTTEDSEAAIHQEIDTSDGDMGTWTP